MYQELYSIVCTLLHAHDTSIWTLLTIIGFFIPINHDMGHGRISSCMVFTIALPTWQTMRIIHKFYRQNIRKFSMGYV